MCLVVGGTGSPEGGIMIDLSQMRRVHMVPRTQIGRVQGGATWGDVDRETQVFGLAVGIINTSVLISV